MRPAVQSMIACLRQSEGVGKGVGRHDLVSMKKSRHWRLDR
jgi:hypothetical protein